MTTIYLIRHAQADGNLYRRCQAWYDSLVTPVGYQQIDALKARFAHAHFDAVYSSDLFRTMATAKAICESHALPLITDPELREIRSGCWEDHPWGELLQTDRESLLAFWRCDPAWHAEGAETFDEIRERFDRAVRHIAFKHSGQTIAIFAHGCIIRATLALWLGLPCSRIREIPHGDNTSVALLEYENDNINVRWYNNTDHLSGKLARAPHPAAETDEETAVGIERSSVYFRPLNLQQRQEAYLSARKEFWSVTRGDPQAFDEEVVFQEALNEYIDKPHYFMTAMLNGAPIGMLQLSDKDGVGMIEFMYLAPEFRGRKLGVQLIGQAVSIFRASGFEFIRINCSQTNSYVRGFLEEYGFSQTGKINELEKYISY